MSSPTTDTRALRRAQAGTTEATWLRNLLIGLALAFLLLFLVLPCLPKPCAKAGMPMLRA